MILSDEALRAELDVLTDHAVDSLFVPSDVPAPTIAAQVSRLVVDVERFLDDEREPMARVGMGAIYTRTTNGSALRRPLTSAEVQQLLDSHYHPHHQHLANTVDRTLEAHGRALILDLHSFPASPLPCDQDQRRNRPDICLGTDALHTPPELVDALLEQFEGAGFSVEVDRPYSGTIVPTKHHERDLRVTSVMIEVNRRLYLEGQTSRLSEAAHGVGMLVQACLSRALTNWATRVGNTHPTQ